MVINLRLGPLTNQDPNKDAMGRSWYGYDPDRSLDELWAQNRGVYGFKAERLDDEAFASLSYRGEVLLVAAITGWERLLDPKTGAWTKALIGDVLEPSHDAVVNFKQRTIPAARNPIGYFDDVEWDADVAGTSGSDGGDDPAGSSPDHNDHGNRGGQGWQDDPVMRKQVEDAAQDRLMAHYSEDGWEVEDLRHGNPYDAIARKGNEIRYLEAKGTFTRGDAVIVTLGEVDHARAHPGHCIMGILSDIRVDENDTLDPASGTFVMVPFEPRDKALTPIQYRWTLPG